MVEMSLSRSQDCRVIFDGTQDSVDGKGGCGVQFMQEEGEEMFLEDRVGAGKGMPGMP